MQSYFLATSNKWSQGTRKHIYRSKLNALVENSPSRPSNEVHLLAHSAQYEDQQGQSRASNGNGHDRNQRIPGIEAQKAASAFQLPGESATRRETARSRRSGLTRSSSIAISAKKRAILQSDECSALFNGTGFNPFRVIQDNAGHKVTAFEHSGYFPGAAHPEAGKITTPNGCSTWMGNMIDVFERRFPIMLSGIIPRSRSQRE